VYLDRDRVQNFIAYLRGARLITSSAISDSHLFILTITEEFDLS
jgi:hypothetical protein